MFEKGWKAEAREEIAKARELDPENDVIREIYDYIMGDDGNDGGDDPDGLESLQTMLPVLIIELIRKRYRRFGTGAV